MMAAHIAAKGVTREVDFGEDQPFVDAARAMCWTVVIAAYPGRGPRQKQWLVNGGKLKTEEFRRRVNVELERRGEKPISPITPRKKNAR